MEAVSGVIQSDPHEGVGNVVLSPGSFSEEELVGRQLWQSPQSPGRETTQQSVRDPGRSVYFGLALYTLSKGSGHIDGWMCRDFTGEF